MKIIPALTIRREINGSLVFLYLSAVSTLWNERFQFTNDSAQLYNRTKCLIGSDFIYFLNINFLNYLVENLSRVINIIHIKNSRQFITFVVKLIYYSFHLVKKLLPIRSEKIIDLSKFIYSTYPLVNFKKGLWPYFSSGYYLVRNFHFFIQILYYYLVA